MALQPLFASAPRIKLYVGSYLVGYAIGFNFNVSVEVQPVFALGSFAPISLEPTMYNTVTGTMQIMRLLTTATQATQQGLGVNPLDAQLLGTTASPTSTGVSATGTGLSETQGPAIGSGAQAQANSPLAQGSLFQHLTPSQLLLSQAFDMAMYMKVPDPDQTTVTSPAAGKNGLKEVLWMKISTCRITSRNTNISMGQLVNEPLNFQGLLAQNASDGFTLDSAVKGS